MQADIALEAGNSLGNAHSLVILVRRISPPPLGGYQFHTSGSETARNEAFAFREDACRPLPLVGRGKGWGALSRKLYERQIDAWSDIKKNGCPEPMDTLPD